MKISGTDNYSINKILVLTFILTITAAGAFGQQKISFGVHADPAISWFSTDISKVKNNGARPGFNFGLTYNRYFAQNYSFSTGISLLSAGGKLISSDTTILNISSARSTVMPNNTILYKLQYIAIPVGLKLQTNQIGYVTFFADLGFVPKLAINRKLDVPSLSLSGESASKELRMVNMSYHVTGGVEYSLGGTTALVFGLDFDNNFLDITKDNGNQPNDRVSHKLFSFRFGVNF
jgi:hypothetical protein